jgi:PAS domain S-box-containing protein
MVRILARYKLTPQEQRVLLLAMSGAADHDIAKELEISRETVRVYWKRIRERLGVSKRAAIISKVMQEAAEARDLEQSTESDLLLKEITRRTLVEEQLRAILQGSRDFAIILMQPDRTVLEWNKGAENIMLWLRSEVVGRSGDILFTEEDQARGIPEREAQTAARNGHTSNVRWHRRKDESRFWAVGSMNAIYYEDGTLRGFVKVFADETRLRELEENRGSPLL